MVEYMANSMRRLYVLGWLQWHIVPVLCGLVVTVFVWQPMLQDYWLRNSPQGRLLLQSTGETVEVWNMCPMDPIGPRAYVGRIIDSEVYRAYTDTRKLRMDVSFTMDGNMAIGSPETRSGPGIRSGSASISLGPEQMHMAKVEGYPIQDTRPIPLEYETVWYAIAAADILIVALVFRGILKRVWFWRSSQVQALRQLVPHRIQWWTNHGVVIGRLKKLRAEPCWSIRNSFYRATMEIEGDDGEFHQLPFTPLGLVWRLYAEVAVR
jgi:hypothetical protein